jgi:nucleoside-diphosphate kinase
LRERTLMLIKPDAVAAGRVGAILSAVEREGFEIERLEMMTFDRARAERFYAVHKEKEFFEGLVEFVTSGPLVAGVLAGEDAIARWRGLMGPTDPAEAGAGTLRAKYGSNIQNNAVHGSDAPETAAYEINVVFGEGE